MRLLDHARGHGGVVLDAVGHGRGHGAKRQGEMADLGLQRRYSLLDGGEAGARAGRLGREKARQAGEAGRHQLGDAEGGDGGDVRQPEPQAFEGKRRRRRIEIDRRHQLLVVDQHGRAVAGAVEVGRDRRRCAGKLLEGRAVHRGEAAKRQRVLHPSRMLGLQEIAAFDQRPYQL